MSSEDASPPSHLLLTKQSTQNQQDTQQIVNLMQNLSSIKSPDFNDESNRPSDQLQNLNTVPEQKPILIKQENSDFIIVDDKDEKI